jgi:ribosomal protein S6--L-glutamate ligase
MPAISKTLKGSQGVGVIILESRRQTGSMLDSFYKNKEKLLIQKFIEGNSKDIRAIVIDSKVVVAMERTAPKGEFRANISQGGSGRKIELSDAEKQICINAANACGLTVAGVDIMKNSNNDVFVIEVNGNYGYKVETVTGVDISTPLIEYCERNYKKGNDDKKALKAQNIDLLIEKTETLHAFLTSGEFTLPNRIGVINFMKDMVNDLLMLKVLNSYGNTNKH